MIYLLSVHEAFDKMKITAARKIAFITNAGDFSSNCEQKRAAVKEFFIERGHQIERIDLNALDKMSLEARLRDFDLIYLAGGNTFVLLEAIKKSEFDVILPGLLKEGIDCMGASAGAIVMGPNIEAIKEMDRPEQADLFDYKGLGLVDYVPLPHADTEYYGEKVKKIEKEFADQYTFKKINEDEVITIQT